MAYIMTTHDYVNVATVSIVSFGIFSHQGVLPIVVTCSAYN